MESKNFSSNSREPQQSEDLSSRRVRYFGAFTLLIGMLFLFPKLAPSYMDTAEKSTDRIRGVDSTKTFLGDDGFVNTTVPLVTTTTTTTRNGSVLSSTCKVPDLTAGSNHMATSECGLDMGKRLGRDRKKLAEGLPLNPRAHLFHFPTKVYKPSRTPSDSVRARKEWK